MPKSHDNSGAVRLVKAIRNQSKKVYDHNRRLNMLGTMTATGVYIDAIDEVIPMSDLLTLKESEVKNTGTYPCRSEHVGVQPGDRIVCLPVGDYFVILGKVE